MGFLILALMLMALLGFYHTYLNRMPDFEGITLKKHFHAAFLFMWFVLMVVQPFLIHYKKYRIHKTLVYVAYMLVPLIMLSIFLVSKDKFHRMAPLIPHEENIGELALNIPSIFYFFMLFYLAMYYKKKREYHIRYMVANALLVFGPGIGRVFINYADASFAQSVVMAIMTTELITVGLIFIDIYRKKPFKPYLVALAFQLSFHLVWTFRYSEPWQYVGNLIAKYLF